MQLARGDDRRRRVSLRRVTAKRRRCLKDVEERTGHERCRDDGASAPRSHGDLATVVSRCRRCCLEPQEPVLEVARRKSEIAALGKEQVDDDDSGGFRIRQGTDEEAVRDRDRGRVHADTERQGR